MAPGHDVDGIGLERRGHQPVAPGEAVVARDSEMNRQRPRGLRLYEAPDTPLLVANIATVLTFAVLACSRVPVLAELGSTVAPGTLLALVFSAQLSRPQRPAAAALVSAR